MDFRDVTCYLLPMNAKLQNLFERIAALPDELLGEIEQSIDEIERWRGDVFRLTDEELAAFYRRHGG
jgi:hypothetical protein